MGDPTAADTPMLLLVEHHEHHLSPLCLAERALSVLRTDGLYFRMPAYTFEHEASPERIAKIGGNPKCSCRATDSHDRSQSMAAGMLCRLSTQIDATFALSPPVSGASSFFARPSTVVPIDICLTIRAVPTRDVGDARREDVWSLDQLQLLRVS